MKLLENKLFPEISGSWYAPSEEIKKYKSVICVTLCNISNSAGDWDGLFCQKRGGLFYIIPFWQENKGFGRGFELTTGEHIAKTRIKPDHWLLLDIYDKWCQNFAPQTSCIFS